jgi:hypothetical protein
MTTTERKVTPRPDYNNGSYVIEQADGGYSCWGFDVVLDRIDRIHTELSGRGVNFELPTLVRGSMEAYDTMQNLLHLLEQACEADGERAVFDLSPQLTGLEGWRVEVVTTYGDTRRFIVGKSTGWAPCHLEIARRDSSGGMGASREYKSVRPIEKVR